MNQSDGHSTQTPVLDLFLRHKRLIYKVIRRYFFNSADIDDIIQETLARAIEMNRDDIRHPKQFLIGIARNVAREELTRRAKMTTATIEDCGLQNHPSSEVPADTALESREKLRILVQAVSALPPQCRKVFLLKHSLGASHKEISKKLGISVSTVEKHVALGLKTCREHMLDSLNDGATGERVEYIFDARRRESQ